MRVFLFVLSFVFFGGMTPLIKQLFAIEEIGSSPVRILSEDDIVFWVTTSGIKKEGQRSTDYAQIKLYIATEMKSLGRIAGYSQQSKQLLIYPESQDPAKIKALKDALALKFPQAFVTQTTKKATVGFLN